MEEAVRRGECRATIEKLLFGVDAAVGKAGKGLLRTVEGAMKDFGG